MANASPKKKATKSRRSGLKTAHLIKQNQEVLHNVWTALNSQQVLKTLNDLNQLIPLCKKLLQGHLIFNIPTYGIKD